MPSYLCLCHDISPLWQLFNDLLKSFPIVYFRKRSLHAESLFVTPPSLTLQWSTKNTKERKSCSSSVWVGIRILCWKKRADRWVACCKTENCLLDCWTHAPEIWPSNIFMPAMLGDWLLSHEVLWKLKYYSLRLFPNSELRYIISGKFETTSISRILASYETFCLIILLVSHLLKICMNLFLKNCT